MIVPFEYVARIGAPGEENFGSGVLLSADTVLTCAHVIDAEYAKVAYRPGEFNRRAEHNAKLKTRFANRLVVVTLYDGEQRQARLLAIHGHEDLVLLRLLQEIRPGVSPLTFAPPQTGNSRPTMSALGFKGIGGRSYKLVALPTYLAQGDVIATGAEGNTVEGELPPGMSGGPILLTDGAVPLLAGVTTMGEEGVPSGRILRASVVGEFVREHLPEYQNPASVSRSTGLTVNEAVKVGGVMQSVNWLRLSLENAGERAADFLAHRPITYGDVDMLYERSVAGDAAELRHEFFAQLTSSEAEKFCRLLQERGKWQIRLPGMKHLQKIFSVRDEPEVSPQNAAIKPRPPILPLRFDGTLEMSEAGVVLPPRFSEWSVGENGNRPMTASRSMAGGQWRAEPSAAYVSGVQQRALLRPLMTIPIWNEAR